MFVRINMRIIIDMNIYIAPDNEKRLREYAEKGNTMSGLINALLVQFFVKKEPSFAVKETIRAFDKLGTDLHPTTAARITKDCFVCGAPAGYMTDDQEQLVCPMHKTMIDGTGVVKVKWDKPEPVVEPVDE